MNTLPWFKFSPAQWMMGRISRQSAEIQIAFLRLCCSYWTDGCAMSSGRAALELEGHYEKLLALQMIEEIDGMIAIKFLDDQAQELAERRGKLSAAGRASSAKRAKEADKSLTQVEHVLPKIDKRKQEKTKQNDAEFDLFWAQYPRKENKHNAIKAWSKLSAEDKSAARIRLYTAFVGKDTAFIPHASTWLNGRRFEDEAISPPQQNDAGHNHFY